MGDYKRFMDRKLAEERAPNTLHIEVTVRGSTEVEDALETILAHVRDGDMGNAMVLHNRDGDEIGMACMVYREPGSGGQG